MAILSALLVHEEEKSALAISGFEIHPSVVLGCLALALGYWYLVGPARRRFGWPGGAVAPWRAGFWGLAVATIFLALDGPLHKLADESLFSAHMVQHMLLMMVMPPFLILGLPPELVRHAVRDQRVLAAGRFLTKPIVAFLAYNLVFVGWHLPAAYNLALTHHPIHIVQHLMFISVSVMMWWPVVAPVAELEQIPDGPMLMLYVFAFALLMTIPAAFLTLSGRQIYPFYESAPRITPLTALEDQRLGGLIMWVPGFVLYLIAITAIWFRWTKDEYAEWREEAREARAKRAEAALAGS